MRYFAAFAAALIAFVATADALALIDSFAWWPVVYVITAAGGVAGIKVQPLRPYAIGWLAGVAATAVIAAVIIITRLS